MNKTELVNRISQKSVIHKVAIRETLDLFSEVLLEALCKGERVILHDLGIFTIKETKAKMARNPKTGEKVFVPVRKKVCFSASSQFKKKVQSESKTE